MHIKSIRLSIALILSGLASLTMAEEIQVWGRAYDYSCGYFSRRAADLAVTFKDESLPFGTEVKLIAGFGGSSAGGGHNIDVSWADRVEIAAKSINVSTWEARILDKTLHGRTEGRFLDKVQFVFEARVPGSAPKFVNGGSSWGFYETVALTGYISCVNNGVIPDWHPVSITTVTRN